MIKVMSATKRLLDDLHESKRIDKYHLGTEHWDRCISMIEDLQEVEKEFLINNNISKIKSYEQK